MTEPRRREAHEVLERLRGYKLGAEADALVDATRGVPVALDLVDRMLDKIAFLERDRRSWMERANLSGDAPRTWQVSPTLADTKSLARAITALRQLPAYHALTVSLSFAGAVAVEQDVREDELVLALRDAYSAAVDVVKGGAGDG